MSTCVVFEGKNRIAFGDLPEAAKIAKRALERGGTEQVLVFDAETSHPIEIDFRGTEEDLANRLGVAPASQEPPKRPGPGRPKLGVVAREVTLLPKHWDWLNSQPGGASVALRKLVEEGRKRNSSKDQRRRAQESAYRFMATMAGDLPGYEEALRALYAEKAEDFGQWIQSWPEDVREHARTLGLRAMGGGVSPESAFPGSSPSDSPGA